MFAFCLFTAFAVVDLPPADHVGRAKEFLELLKKGDFTKAAEPFDATMLKKMPADKLKETWEMLNKQFGALKETGGTRTETLGKYELVFIGTQFEKVKLEMRLAFDPDHKIAGLGFQPPKPAVEYK